MRRPEVWKEIPALYDIARQVNHDFGFPWTDPRTGVTYPPPKRPKPKRKAKAPKRKAGR
jgi:hypothetical protein